MGVYMPYQEVLDYVGSGRGYLVPGFRYTVDVAGDPEACEAWAIENCTGWFTYQRLGDCARFKFNDKETAALFRMFHG